MRRICAALAVAVGAVLVDDLRPLIIRPPADAVKGWQMAMEKMTTQLNETPAQLTTSLGPDFPAVVTGLPRLNAVFVDFADKSKRLDASVGDFAKTKQIPYRTLPWLFIPPGWRWRLVRRRQWPRSAGTTWRTSPSLRSWS